MNAIILDTETHTLHGLPIQIAYLPCSFEQGGFAVDANAVFDQLFSIGENRISFAAMAVHHILESDLAGKPDYQTFQLPEVTYIIGHNIEYDFNALAKCGLNMHYYKPICTLALARKAFPDADSHSIGALSYLLSMDRKQTREKLRNAHDAKTDILLTADILSCLIKILKIRSMEELYQVASDALIPVAMPFGKHKGTALINLPDSYVNWLLDQENLDKNLRTGLLNRKVKP